VRLGVGVQEFQVRELEFISALAGATEHRLRQVNAKNRSGGTYAFSQLK
jgi:hypothetical protein